MTHVINKLIMAVLAAAFAGSFAVGAAAQVTPMPPRPGVRVEPTSPAPLPPRPHRMTGEPSEKAIAVAPNVNLTLCVNEGDLKVNGWSRNEVRIYVEDGPKYAFKVVDKGPDGKPVWVSTTLANPRPGMNSDCIWGSAIEIDAPVGASVKLIGKAINAEIDSVKKAGVKTVGGDIVLRNIKEGLSANTYEGDITVEESWGSVSLESTTGNIVVVDSGPSDIGDTFKAKTNSGAVALTRVGHRAQEVNSTSGSVVYNGDIKSGGSYSFSTINGTIRLTLPAATNCKLAATYTTSSFTTELPFKLTTENVAPGDLKSVVGDLGSGGDAIVRVTTAQGLIGIKKQ